MKKIAYLLFCVALFAGCNEEDDIVPRTEDEVFYQLPQGNHDYDERIVDYYNNHGFYILYKFEKKDLYWNNVAWTEYLMGNPDFVYSAEAAGYYLGEPADTNYVGQLLEMCEKGCFNLYPENYLDYMPLRFLLCSMLSNVVTAGTIITDEGAVIVRDTVKINVYRSFSRLAVNWASSDLDTITETDKLYFSKDLNTEFISVLQENDVFEYDEDFMITGHSYSYANLLGENLFKRGFLTNSTLVSGNITQSRINDFMAFLKLCTVPLDLLNAEPAVVGSQDLEPSLIGLFSRQYADEDDGRVDGYTGIDRIKQKYEFMINLLKTEYGIDTDKLQYPDL